MNKDFRREKKKKRSIRMIGFVGPLGVVDRVWIKKKKDEKHKDND